MPGTTTVAFPGRKRPGPLRRWGAACSGALLLVLSLPVAAPAKPELPPDGIEKLDKDYSRDQRTLIDKLGRGEMKPRPEDEPVIDRAAQWFIYRFTWEVDPRTKQSQTDPGRMDGLYKDVENELLKFAKKDYRSDNQEFVKQFGKRLIAHGREVVLGGEGNNPPANDKVQVRYNVTRVLARLAAEPQQEEVADVLLEALAKDPSPAVQYAALHGLGNLLAQEQPRLDDKGVRLEPAFMKKEREAKIILALIAFIERKLPETAAMPPEEVGGLRALRREAVRALALNRAPAVLDDKKKMVAPTALVLLRVLRKDTSFALPPGPDEQLEAALGLTRLQSKLYDGYQPDYTAHELGMFVSEFATRFVTEGGERGWRVNAARLSDGLVGPMGFKADVDKNVKDPETKKYIAEVLAKSAEVLKAIENKVGSLNPAGFGDWIGKTLPKSQSVYRDMPEAKVNPPADQ